MKKKFNFIKKDLIEKLIQVQSEIVNLNETDNPALYRMMELDMYQLLEKLKLNPCEICKYHEMNKDKKCELEARCKSYILIKKISEDDKDIKVKLDFKYKLM